MSKLTPEDIDRFVPEDDILNFTLKTSLEMIRILQEKINKH